MMTYSKKGQAAEEAIEQLSAVIEQAVSSPAMEYLGSLNDQQVHPIYQLGGNAAMTVQHHLRGLQPSPRTTEEPIVMGGVQPVLSQQQTVVISDQQPQLQDHIVVDMRPQIPDPEAEAEAEDGLSELGLFHFRQGMLESAVGVALGPNQSKPIWRLRLFATLNFVTAAMVGVLFYPGNLEGVHATYLRVKLITTVGVPIAVATITFLVTRWLASNPNGRSNWITGLSVANFSMFVCPLIVYGALQGGTGGSVVYVVN